jgi:glyoxylase-like metal-dependent hydrolase (beta-lactamase superfamily II)
LGALAVANQRLIAAFLNQPESKIRMLTNEIGIFIERGGPMLFYMGKDANVVVDSQWPEQASSLIDELKKRNNRPIEILINTHHHIGNTSGNITFRGSVKNIVAHDNAKKNQMTNSRLMKTENKQAYPTLTYKDTWCQKFGKENVCVYYYGPAHTNGDSIIHFEYNDIVHMGDVVHNRTHPAIDRVGGGSLKKWAEALPKIYNDFGKNTKFVFGHAGNGFDFVGTREDLRLFSNYLGQLIIHVENEIKRGKSKKEIIKSATDVVPGSNPQWKGEGLARTYAAAYDEISYYQALQDQ